MVQVNGSGVQVKVSGTCAGLTRTGEVLVKPCAQSGVMGL